MTDLTPQQRRIELHRLLSRGATVVASQLAKRWKCNQRTIRRDLLAMRDVDGLHIEFDPLDQTWRYTGEVAEIPALLVSAEDRRALLFSLQSASQFEDTPVCAQIRHLYESLLATLPPERATRFQAMMQSVRFTGPSSPPIPKSIWDAVLLCLEAHETMHITYTDGYYGSTTQRDIDPYGLIVRNRSWILIAYCHRHQKVLTFSLPRITAAQSTDKTFTPPAGFMDQYLADAFDGLQSTGQTAKVVLRIAKDAPIYVRERPWSTNETRRQDDHGNTIVQFQTPALFAVEREVRAEAGWVELLEPAASRQNLHESGQALADAHKPSGFAVS